MAQYYWVPKSEDVGGQPSNMEYTAWGGDLSVSVDDIIDGTPRLRLDSSSGNATDRFLRFDSLEGNDPGGVADIEVWALANGVQDVDAMVGGRLHDSDTTDRGYFGGLNQGDDEAQLKKYMSFGQRINEQAWSETSNIYNVRTQISGNEIRTKLWPEDDPEPSSWTLTTTDSDITSAGSPGVYQWTGGSFFIYELGVGTNGDPAPMTQVSTSTSVTPATTTATADPNAATVTSRVTTTAIAPSPTSTATATGPVAVDSPIGGGVAPATATTTVTTANPSATSIQQPVTASQTATVTETASGPVVNSRIPASTAPPDAAATGGAEGVTVTAIGKGEITGTVYQSDGETGLADATVVAILDGAVDTTATTASDGTFSLVVSDETEEYHVATLEADDYYSYPYTTASEY